MVMNRTWRYHGSRYGMGNGTAVTRHAVDAMFSSGDKTPAAPAPVAASRGPLQYQVLTSFHEMFTGKLIKCC